MILAEYCSRDCASQKGADIGIQSNMSLLNSFITTLQTTQPPLLEVDKPGFRICFQAGILRWHAVCGLLAVWWDTKLGVGYIEDSSDKTFLPLLCTVFGEKSNRNTEPESVKGEHRYSTYSVSRPEKLPLKIQTDFSGTFIHTWWKNPHIFSKLVKF